MSTDAGILSPRVPTPRLSCSLHAWFCRNAHAPMPFGDCSAAAGYVGIDRHECQERGCCWLPLKPSPHRPHIDLPWCFHQNSKRSHYAVDDVKPTGARRCAGHCTRHGNPYALPHEH